MGDLDNLILKSILLSAGLMQIYGLPPISNKWAQVNYTFDLDPNYHSEYMIASNLTINYLRMKAGNGFPNALVA